jgi:hypothetical protein
VILELELLQDGILLPFLFAAVGIELQRSNSFLGLIQLDCGQFGRLLVVSLAFYQQP